MDIIDLLIEKFTKLDGKTIAFTMSACFVVENFLDRILKVSDVSDLIFCNDNEIKKFVYSLNGLETDDFKTIIEKTHQAFKPRDRILVVTRGKDTVLISKYNYKNSEVEFLKEIPVFKVSADEIIDTNGCGDAFVGGFLSQYLQGKDLETCGRIGNYCSSIVIRNSGCTFPEKFEIKL